MPRATELPEAIALIAQRHAIELRDATWDGDVERLVRRLEEVVDTIPPCPYPGMVAFGRDDAARFFGREKEVAEIRDRLASQGVLCLVGPSGCGKSSLIEAGVLADLDSAETTHWDVRTLRPGGSPMFALGVALGADPDDTTTPEAAVRAVRQSLAAGPAAGRLLLVIDQLEELFAQASTDDQAQFIAALAGIHELGRLDRSRHPRRLLRRADGERAVAARRRRQGRRAAAAGDALAEAIEKPATSCHVTIEPDLLEQLVSDAGSEPGALPLLQEALVRLWGTMRLHRISLAAYESIGGEGQTAWRQRSRTPPTPRWRRSRPSRFRSPSVSCSGWSSSVKAARHASPAPGRGAAERGRRRSRAGGRARSARERPPRDAHRRGNPG